MQAGEQLTAPTRLRRLASAILGEQRIEFRYLDASGEATVRAVDPLALAFAGGPWLLAGHCHLRDAFRTFRVERMEGLRLLDEAATATPPAGFSARDLGARHFDPDGTGQRATVQLFGPLRHAAEALFPSALLEWPNDVSVYCHLRATDLQVLASLVASLGSEANLIHPAEGVEAMAELRSLPF